MKNFKNYLSFLAVFALLFTSCSKDEAIQDAPPSENVATLSFKNVLADFNSTNKQSQSDYPDCNADLTPTHVTALIDYEGNGDPFTVELDLGMENNEYFTLYHEDLEIPVPDGEDWVTVTLLDFDVYSDGTLLWTAPMEGADFETFVTDALPMDMELRAGSKTYQDVEVLCFDERQVLRYGYQFFDIVPKELRQLCVFVNYCSDAGRHYTADYNLTVYYYNPDTEVVGDEIFSGSPDAEVEGLDTFYTDPLCFAIPEPAAGIGMDEPYLYYEISLVPWDDNYTFSEKETSGFLTWNDVIDLLDPDENGNWEENTDADYLHVQLNCETDDQEPLDTDNDTVPNTTDNCPNTANTDQADDDNDEIGNVCDTCPTQAGPAANNGCPVDPGFTCEEDWDNTAWGNLDNCKFAYFNGTTDFIEVTGELPLYLAFEGGAKMGDVNLKISETGDIEFTTTALGFDFASGYEIIVTDKATFCETNLVDYRNSKDPSEISGAIPDGILDLNITDLDYPLWIKARVLVCPPN